MRDEKSSRRVAEGSRRGLRRKGKAAAAQRDAPAESRPSLPATPSNNRNASTAELAARRLSAPENQNLDPLGSKAD